MKKNYSAKFIIGIIFFICVSNTLKAQMVYLPDTNFRNALIGVGYSACITGDSIDASCPAVSNAISLDVHNANIQSMEGIQAFTNLQDLTCYGNWFVSLPALPGSITSLDCGGNELTTLPALPGGLVSFYCDNNHLTSIPALPNSLTYFWCSFNQLSTLPALPNSLEQLNCSDNILTSLPAFPNSLITLYCDGNQLTTLPALPHSYMSQLWCFNNQLTSLPEFPDSVTELYCHNNPGLSCLPQLKGGLVITFYNTAVTCLPNYGNIINSDPPFDSVPLCGMFNPNGCDVYWNISGRTYFDSNSNCQYNSVDVPEHNIHIMLYNNGNLQQQVFTPGGGLYSFDLSATGNYIVQIDTSNLPFQVLCPGNLYYNDDFSASDSLFYDNDFALRCETGFDLGAWSVLGFPFIPGHNTAVDIHAGDISNFYGVNCAGGVSGSVTITFTGPVAYLGPAAGALTPSNITGNTLTYNIADFGTVNFYSDFRIVMATDTMAEIDSLVCFTVSVSPAAGDNNPSNNILSHCFTVVSSFDPNEKEVYPTGDVDLTENKWLTYTINFQNTGTAPAEHIYIDDTLSNNLDLSTFQLLAYSHQPLVQILEGGIARFNFPNINLPDSNSNEPASHGYVQYKIKVKDNATVGTQIDNTAYIYFDFNAPVLTNTTVNTVTTAVGIVNINDDLEVSVFPNPTQNEFTVYCPQFAIGKKVLLKVVDTFGKEIMSKQVTAVNTKLETENWSSGIYFLRIETTDDVVVKKLIKE